MIRVLPVLVCLLCAETAFPQQRTIPITTFSLDTLRADVDALPLPSTIRNQVRGLLEEASRATDRGSPRAASPLLSEFAGIMRAQPAGVVSVERAGALAGRADRIRAALDEGLGLGGAEIGPEGGVLEVVDPNSPLYRTRLEIPAGAILRPTRVSIREDTNRPANRALTLSGSGVALHPSGLELFMPATLSVPYGDADGNSTVDGTSFPVEWLKVGVLDRAGRMAFPKRTLDATEQVQQVEIYELGAYWNVSWRWEPGVLTYRMAWPFDGVALDEGADLPALADAVRSAVGTWAALLESVGVSFQEVPEGQPAVIQFGFFSTATPLSVLSSGNAGPLAPGLGRGLGDGAAQFYAAADPLTAGQGFAIMFNSDFGVAPGSLAWTPAHGGDARSVAIESVALHAVGHVMGLEDRPGLVQPPVMATGANLRRPVVCLGVEDIRAFGRLYDIGDADELPACAHAAVTGLPPALDFGTVASGVRETAEFTLSNGGTGTLIVGSVESTDGFLVTTPIESATLAPGAALAFEVEFRALAPGTASGELRVLSSAADGAVIVPLEARVPFESPECTLTSRPAHLTAGETATLSWTLGGDPASASISGGIGAVPPEAASREVAPGDTTRYVMTVSNPAGDVACEVTIEVARAISSEVIWTRPVATSGEDSVQAVLPGPYGLLVGGEVGGTVESVGEAFVALYDTGGEPLWERRSPASRIEALAVDELGIYAAGVTSQALVGGAWQGDFDAFVRKYDFDGNILWTDQFGTFASDRASAVAADSGGIFVTGVTSGSLTGDEASGGLDLFVRRYTPDGGVSWTRQWGTPADDVARDIVATGGGFALVGDTRGGLSGQAFRGGSDAFVSVHDGAGAILWTRQFGGAGSEFAAAIAADESGLYVAGGSETALPGQQALGGFDAFARKYDREGREEWTRQFGTALTESASDIGVDATGVFVVGATEGTMAGQLSRGAFDAFVRALDLDGGVVWTRYVGTPRSDDAFSISPYHLAVYIGGSTLGTFDASPNAGASDGYVGKILK